MRCNLFILPAVLLLVGCTKYEYDIVQPAELSRRIGRDMDAVVQREPLEYRMRTVDNRLVVRIFNQTDDNIQLIGERSSVVDADGQSHPLRGGPIAPRSFLKLIIPPPRPQVYQSGPTFGVGVGVGMSRHHHHHHRHHRHFVSPGMAYHDPQYLSVHDENDTRYWDWKGEGEARLLLLFQRRNEEFRHEFTFRRRKL